MQYIVTTSIISASTVSADRYEYYGNMVMSQPIDTIVISTIVLSQQIVASIVSTSIGPTDKNEHVLGSTFIICGSGSKSMPKISKYFFNVKFFYVFIK
jgi:hypothetical protein